MTLGDWIALSALLFVLVWAGISEISERKLKKKITALKDEVNTMLVYVKRQAEWTETDSAEYQVQKLQDSAEMLKFCLQCPLYQDKVKEGEENRIYKRTNNQYSRT